MCYYRELQRIKTTCITIRQIASAKLPTPKIIIINRLMIYEQDITIKYIL